MPTDQSTSANGLRSQHEHLDDIRWHVPSSMTASEVQSKCGDQTQLSCDNKATYAGDTTNVNSGLGGDLFSNLIGSGSRAGRAGIVDQCSKLDLQSMYSSSTTLISKVVMIPVPITIAVPIQDLINQRCKQNIACFANSHSDAVSSSLSLSSHVNAKIPSRATTLLALACLALPLAPSCKRVFHTVVVVGGLVLDFEVRGVLSYYAPPFFLPSLCFCEISLLS